jgi:hypothetical protein
MESSILNWRKSSYSGGNGGSCVEVADSTSRVLVRDTTDRTGPALAFSQQDWREFTRRIRSGQAGRLTGSTKGRSRHVRERPFAVPAYRRRRRRHGFEC